MTSPAQLILKNDKLASNHSGIFEIKCLEAAMLLP